MKQKARRPTCPRCRHPEYKVEKAIDGRPSFTCTKCGQYWTSGKDGREYVNNRLAIREET